jgi:hypothetical protein
VTKAAPNAATKRVVTMTVTSLSATFYVDDVSFGTGAPARPV